MYNLLHKYNLLKDYYGFYKHTDFNMELIKLINT